MSRIDYTTKVTTLEGEERDLTPYEGKVMLVVNTASKCGFTPQYKPLERLWNEIGEEDFVVLGFPCNQFGKQEPGSEEEIATFCERNYGVTFPMHAKVDVNGSDTHPLYEQLKAGAPGMLGSKAIKWNFTKFLVGRDGTVLKRYAPNEMPDAADPDLKAALESK